jgi:hypothetical protein
MVIALMTAVGIGLFGWGTGPVSPAEAPDRYARLYEVAYDAYWTLPSDGHFRVGKRSVPAEGRALLSELGLYSFTVRYKGEAWARGRNSLFGRLTLFALLPPDSLHWLDRYEIDVIADGPDDSVWVRYSH